MFKYVLLIITAGIMISACAARETVISVTDCSTLQGEMRDQCYANNGIGNYAMPATGTYQAPVTTAAPSTNIQISGDTPMKSEPRPRPHR